MAAPAPPTKTRTQCGSGINQGATAQLPSSDDTSEAGDNGTIRREVQRDLHHAWQIGAHEHATRSAPDNLQQSPQPGHRSSGAPGHRAGIELRKSKSTTVERLHQTRGRPHQCQTAVGPKLNRSILRAATPIGRRAGGSARASARAARRAAPSTLRDNHHTGPGSHNRGRSHSAYSTAAQSWPRDATPSFTLPPRQDDPDPPAH